MSAARIAVSGSAALAIAAAALAEPTIKHWEGYSNDPYRDVAGILTVCWGETAGVQNRRYSDAECNALYRRSIMTHAVPVTKCLPARTPLSVVAAFVSFAYNAGVSAACGSTAAKRVRAGNYAAACEAITWWNKVTHPVTGKKVVSKGLVNRRDAERKLCLSGLS